MLFTDAVVAIAITLLALELPAPEGDTNTALWHSVTHARPEYQSFLISFLVIWAHWSGHRHVFRSVSGLDRVLSALNAMWLLTVVIIPFATKVLAGDGGFQLRFGFYALVQTLTSVLFGLMAWYARRAGLYAEGTPPRHATRTLVRSGIVAVCFAVSIPVALVSHWAYLCWLAVPCITSLVMRRSRPARR
jgi:uncharacterized membrane protein